MLSDKDRIFTNLYGIHDPGLEAAKRRGCWIDTKAFIEKLNAGFTKNGRSGIS